jgi:hypothetical protein
VFCMQVNKPSTKLGVSQVIDCGTEESLQQYDSHLSAELGNEARTEKVHTCYESVPS